MKNDLQRFTTASHFEGKDAVVRNIYDSLIKSLKTIGPLTEDPKKTSIHINNRTALAGIATRKAYLILTIKSDRKIGSPRINKTEQASAHRFHHEVKLTSPADVDAELIGWLRIAYEMSA